MKDKKLLIADGHHRYETALAYREEMRRAHPDPCADLLERRPLRGQPAVLDTSRRT